MLYKNIKSLRKQRRIKAEDVANAIGVSVSEYYKYEQGRRDMSIITAQQLARFYNVSLDYLVQPEFLKHTIDETSGTILNYLATEWEGDFNSMIQLIATYASMPVHMRKDVAEHNITMFVNGLPECNIDLVDLINVEKCKEIVNRLKKR